MAKRKGKTPKQKASDAMSRYIRLRDALEYCRQHRIDVSQFNRPEDVIGQCCTCGTVKSWYRMDAGHCIGRGLGGGSGVYFNPYNMALQCKLCNGFEQGSTDKFWEYLEGIYGPLIKEQLTLLHHTHKYEPHEYPLLEQHYKNEYKKLVKDNF